MTRPPLVVHSGGAVERPDAAPPGAPAPLPFHLGTLLGRGGMGEVWSAWDPRLQREVALKSVAPGDAAGARRLVREAILTAGLEHPGIVPIHEAGRGEDGRAWYAMRLLPGHTLAQAIAETRTLAERLRLVRHVLDAAQAVAYAQGQGILHRDLKPANILTGGFGETIVADWGLACTLAEAGRGEPGVGTPGYMSPEQEAGRLLDARTDVYSLGAVLAEVITGLPRDADTPARLRVLPGVPPELAAVADRALQPEPDRRYPDAGAFAADLLAWFEGRRVGAHDYTTLELLSRLILRWRLPVAIAGVGVAAVGVASAIGWVRTAEERAHAEASEATAAMARDGEARAFAAALRAQAWIASATGLSMDAEILAAHALRRGENADARGVLAAVSGRPRWELAASRPAPDCLKRTLSTDGSAALCLADGRATWVDVETGRAEEAAGRWSRGGFAGEAGAAVLVDGAHDVYTWQAGSVPVRVAGGAARSGVIARSAVPGIQAVMTTTGELRVDVRRGTVEETRACGAAAVQAVAIDATGGLLVACNDQRLLRRAPDGEARVLRVLDPADGVASLIQAVPGGDVFVGTVRGNVFLLGPEGEVRRRERLGEEAVATVTVAGDRAAVGLDNGELAVWDLASGVVEVRLRGHGTQAAWTGEGSLRLFGKAFEDRVAPRRGRPHRVALDAGIGALAFAPDGGSLVVAEADGRAFVLDPWSGSRVVDLRVDDAVVKDVAFAPDGSGFVCASAGTAQTVYTSATGGSTTLPADEAWRRAAWFARSGIVGVPYKPLLRRVTLPAGALGPDIVAPAGLTDLETTPDGRRGAGIGPDDRVWVAEDDGALRWRPLTTFPEATGLGVAGDDVFLASDREVVRIGPTGARTWTAPAFPGSTDLAVSPDGRWVAVGRIDGSVDVWRVGEAEPRAHLLGHHARVAAVVFSPDSAWLATGGWDHDVRQWSVAAFDADVQGTADAVERAWGRRLDEVLGAPILLEGR